MLPLDGNIFFLKFTQILDVNLWPFVAEDFVESLITFKDDMHWRTVYKFSQELKTYKKIFPHDLASLVSGLKCNRKCMFCS